MMWGMGAMMGAGWWNVLMWLNLLFGLGLLALLIMGIIAGIRWLTKSATPPQVSREPDRVLELLRERYVRGEIGREEFERMRQDLS